MNANSTNTWWCLVSRIWRCARRWIYSKYHRAKIDIAPNPFHSWKSKSKFWSHQALWVFSLQKFVKQSWSWASELPRSSAFRTWLSLTPGQAFNSYKSMLCRCSIFPPEHPNHCCPYFKTRSHYVNVDPVWFRDKCALRSFDRSRRRDFYIPLEALYTPVCAVWIHLSSDKWGQLDWVVVRPSNQPKLHKFWRPSRGPQNRRIEPWPSLAHAGLCGANSDSLSHAISWKHYLSGMAQRSTFSSRWRGFHKAHSNRERPQIRGQHSDNAKKECEKPGLRMSGAEWHVYTIRAESTWSGESPKFCIVIHIVHSCINLRQNVVEP